MTGCGSIEQSASSAQAEQVCLPSVTQAGEKTLRASAVLLNPELGIRAWVLSKGHSGQSSSAVSKVQVSAVLASAYSGVGETRWKAPEGRILRGHAFLVSIP